MDESFIDSMSDDEFDIYDQATAQIQKDIIARRNANALAGQAPPEEEEEDFDEEDNAYDKLYLGAIVSLMNDYKVERDKIVQKSAFANVDIPRLLTALQEKYRSKGLRV